MKNQSVLTSRSAVSSLFVRKLGAHEIAPGIDLETQILALMGFRPIMRKPLKLMDPRIFACPHGLKADVLTIPWRSVSPTIRQTTVFFHQS